MRQRGNLLFIDTLNAAWIVELSDKDVEVLNSRKSDVKSVLTETLLIFDENNPKDSYDRSNLDSLWEVGIETYDIDKVPQRTPTTLIENLHTKSQNSSCGLEYCLHLKKNARLMLRVNIDPTDRLVNGQLGYVYNIAFTESQVSKIYVKNNDSLVGNCLMGIDFLLQLESSCPKQ